MTATERPQLAATASARAEAVAGGQLPGVECGQQLAAGGLGGGVVADLVEQVAGELLGAGADGAAAAAGD